MAPCTCYATKPRPASARLVRDAELVKTSRSPTRRTWVSTALGRFTPLSREGIPVAQRAVERLMRAEELRGFGDRR